MLSTVCHRLYSRRWTLFCLTGHNVAYTRLLSFTCGRAGSDAARSAFYCLPTRSKRECHRKTTPIFSTNI